MEEHHEMKVEQFEFGVCPKTMNEYIEFHRVEAKSVTGFCSDNLTVSHAYVSVRCCCFTQVRWFLHYH